MLVDLDEAKKAMLKQQAIDLRDPALIGISFDGDLAVEILDRLPDAEKKGEWIPEEDEVGLRWFRCSECRRIVSETHQSKYCPNCGAKMEGDTLK